MELLVFLKTFILIKGRSHNDLLNFSNFAIDSGNGPNTKVFSVRSLENSRRPLNLLELDPKLCVWSSRHLYEEKFYGFFLLFKWGYPQNFCMQMYSLCEGHQTWQENYIKCLLHVNNNNIPREKGTPTKMAVELCYITESSNLAGHTWDLLSFTQNTKCLPGVINDVPDVPVRWHHASKICKIEDYHLPTFPASNAQLAECEGNCFF